MNVLKVLKPYNESFNELIEDLTINNRQRISQNILQELRHFVEHVMLAIFCIDTNVDLNDDWKNTEAAVNYCRKHGKYRLITNFHKNHLQKSISHRIQRKENAESLLIYYADFLIAIKNFLNKEFNIKIFEKINQYPLNLDSTFKNYYKNIISILNSSGNKTYIKNSVYYVRKKKPIYLDDELFYEVVLSPANDKKEKFDRFVAFTKIDVFNNYAIKPIIYEQDVNLFDKQVPIKFIESYSVSIRQCEIAKFSRIFSMNLGKITSTKEYIFLMDFIAKNHMSLNDIVRLNKNDYEAIKDEAVTFGAKKLNIFNLLDLSKQIIDKNEKGKNILLYLLYSMNNELIADQLDFIPNAKISELCLNNACLPFDETPFAANLKNARHRIIDLYKAIGLDGHEDELLARDINNCSSNSGELYVDLNDDYEQDEINKLIFTFNSKVPSFQPDRKLAKYDKYTYVEQNENLTKEIIDKLLALTKSGIPNYSFFANNWLQNNMSNVYGDDKKTALKNCFLNSSVFFVYGAAGTGKSTFVNFVLDIFKSSSKICLATTHPAVDNLRRKISTTNCTFKTISSFIRKSNAEFEYDIAVIDECSIVSDRDMASFLKKIKCKVLLLCGDIHQLSSIDFGNWFIMAKQLMPNDIKIELLNQYRTDDNGLIGLWTKVREYDESTIEYISNNNYQSKFDKTIFERKSVDEIILCLNYDGLYGINSINRYLQAANTNESVRWYQYIFKIGDPILFYDTNRFYGYFYNNLKGTIIGIKKDEEKITFDVRVNKQYSDLFINSDITILDSSTNNWTDFRFSVYGYNSEDYDEDTDEKHFVPFQIAYAVSIHKAQGLEYESVKVLLTNEIEEKITHNVFYTAITRTKKYLKIYWSPETCSNIMKNIIIKPTTKDISIFKNKFGY